MRKWSDQRNGDDPGVHPTSDDLNAYLDGDAGDDESARIARHLETCDACREDLAGLRATTALLRTLPEPRLARSFQLGPEHARSRGRFWDRLGLRLMPALPALRAATVAVALLLAGVTAADVLENERDSAPVSEELAQVAPTATVANDAARSAAPAAAEESLPTAAVADTPAVEPAAASTRAAPPPAPTAAPGVGELGESAESDAVTSEEEQTGGDTADSIADAPIAPDAQTAEIAAAPGDAEAEPPTGAEVADGDELALPEQSAAAGAAADTSAASSSAGRRDGIAPSPAASPESDMGAAAVIASPTAEPPVPTPAPSAPATPAGGVTRLVDETAADDSPSGWRVAQIAFAAALVFLLGMLAAVWRVRPSRIG